MAGWTIEKAKVPAKKPVLDTATHIAVVRAHRDQRHVSVKNYWAGICPVCWTQVTEPGWDYPGKGR